MRERDLKASLQEIGALIPGLSWSGNVVDGRRKLVICEQLRIPFHVHAARTLKEACSILWTRHPMRALELAGKRPLLELAELCTTSTTAIAAEIAASKPQKKRATSARIIRSVDYHAVKRQKMTTMLIVLEPELKAYAREAAAQVGHNNVSKLVRKALWRQVVELVPNAGQFQPARCVPRNQFNSVTAKRARRARDR